MKLVAAFLLIFTMNLSANVYSQRNQFDIHLNNASLKEVFKEIMNQSDYSFIYNNSDVSDVKNISIKKEKALLDDILNGIFKNTDLLYVVKNNVIVVKKSNKTEVSKQQVKKRKLTGTVKDKDGNILPGVSVVIKGTQTGVATDINGKFEIKADENKQVTLVFSFVGMKTKEIRVGKNSNLNVVLESSSENLNEVVVTGYQTISKERATGSFNIISKEDVSRPTSNIGTALVGKISGVQANFDEDGNPTFEIRGKSSLYANAKPLIVVDGFPIEGDFNSINPNDVESITVLKDAAAASIWGARSANGVIVITTKGASKLKAGTVKVDINSFVKFSAKPDLDYLLNQASSEDCVKYEQMSWGKWGRSKGSDNPTGVLGIPSPIKYYLTKEHFGYITEEELHSLINTYSKQSNRKQLEDNLMQNPFTQQHNISVSTASDMARNNISVMYEGRDKYLKGNDNKKVMVNFRNSTKLTDWLDFTFSGMYLQEDVTLNGRLSRLSDLTPYQMLLDEKGERLPVLYGMDIMKWKKHWEWEKFPYPDMTYNPITELENLDNTRKNTQSRFQGAVVFKPLKGLRINSQFQYETFRTEQRTIQKEGSYDVRYSCNYYTHWDRENNTFTENLPKGDILTTNSTEAKSYTWRNQLDYNRTFGDHSINFVGGMEINEKVREDKTAPVVYGYDDDKLSVGDLPNGYGSYNNKNLEIYSWTGYRTTIAGKLPTFSYSTDRFFSAYFNAAYTYKDKYTLSGSARTDASNLITDDPAYRYSPFWSVGGSWQMSKEDFIKDIAWIDRLILRTTFGYNGNVDRSTSFKALIEMSPTNDTYTNEPIASVSSYGNPTLRWEKTGTLDIGIDYSLLNGKFFGKLDFYRKNAQDLIATVSIPQVNGTGSQKMNVADMVNKGAELEFGTRLPIEGNDIVFNGSFNLSYNHNEITDLYIASYSHSNMLTWGSATTAYVEGKDANTIWGGKYAGLHNDGTKENPNMQPKIVGKDGTLYGFGTWPSDNVINYAYEQGTQVAPWLTSMSFRFKVYDFDISCIMTGKFGHVFRRTSYNYNGKIPNKRFSEVLNANPDEIMPLPQNDNEGRYYFWDRFWETFSYLTEPADLIRMQELGLSYNLPNKYLKKYGLNNLKIYSQVNNVFSIFANDYDEDPEHRLGTMKLQPIYTFGINIGF